MLSLSTGAEAVELNAGWNLVPSHSIVPTVMTESFADSTKVSSVWRWNRATSKWGFYTPSLNASQLSSYAASNGFEVLSEVPTKEGYWVKAPNKTTITVSDHVNFLDGTELQLGWNLVTGNAWMQTPSQFIQKVNWKLTPATRQVSTVWAWNSATQKWRFFAPTLAAQGGTVLADYAA